MKIIATNRKAKAAYQIIETYETGIELKGNEVKSLRVHGCSLDGSFALVEREEVFLYHMHIPEFEKCFYFRADPNRTRKLLLHSREIKKLMGITAQRGLTLVPLKIYFNDRGLVKVELALAKGEKMYDKRKQLRDDVVKREVDRELKKFNRRQ